MAELDQAGNNYATVQTWTEPGTLFARISGDLDLSNAENIRSLIEVALTPDIRRLVFEVSELAFMDSSGIALLAALAQKVSQAELRNPSPGVTRLIQLTALDQLLRISP